MAARLMISLFLAFSLSLIYAHGRALQKNETRDMSFASIKVKVVSRATDSYTGKTNYADVQGLVTICTTFPSLAEANEDPCLPPKWSWIECNSDAKPRIITVDLSARLLNEFGVIPDFSSMDALQKIDLSRNNLIGSIPSFLSKFPNLKELNVAYNLLSGYIPDSLACNKKLKLSVTSNAGLYTSSKCSGSSVDDTTTLVYQTTYTKKSKTPVILGSTISVFLVISIAVGIYAIFRHKAKTAAAIAAASVPGGNVPSNQKQNLPTEEIPINSRPNNMSP